MTQALLGLFENFRAFFKYKITLLMCKYCAFLKKTMTSQDGLFRAWTFDLLITSQAVLKGLKTYIDCNRLGKTVLALM